MTSDLERDLRLALHEGVEHVSPERLRHDAPARRTTTAARVGRGMAGPILAAACVAVLALAVTLVATNRDGATRTGAGRTGTLASIVGRSWTLVAVRHAGTVRQIPARLRAGVSLGRSGVLGAQDGVNDYSGMYELTGAASISVRAGAGTLTGYSGQDPTRVAAIDGIGAILHAGGGGSVRHTIAARRDADTLTLTADGYTLTVTGSAPVADSGAVTSGSATTVR